MKVKPSNRTSPGRPRGGVVVELGPKDIQMPGAAAKTATVTALPAFQLKRILVPLDFSHCSLKSLQYALPFARQFGADLFLLHVVQPYYPVSDMVPMDVEVLEERLRNTSENELLAIRKSLDPDVKATAMTRVGNPHLEIVRVAQETGADLIILSTHGRTGLSHVLMGSTTERVVRHAGCPVLVLREQEHEFLKSEEKGTPNSE